MTLVVAVGVFSDIRGIAQAAEKKPNIIYFLADDLGRDDVGWRGSPIKTPNLDQLAKSGAELTQFYVQPVCSPTRACLMTGRYPIRYGLQVGVVRPWADYGLNTDEYTLPQALKEVGYETAIVGKWHLGHAKREYLPTKRGFEHQYGHYNGALDYDTHDRDGGHDWHKDDQPNYDKGYSTTLLGKEAARLVKEKNPDKPLFLYVPFNAVHSPFQAPGGVIEQYPELTGNRQKYAAMLHIMDEAVGEVVAAVEAIGETENTLFLFSSDNGGPNPGKLTNNGILRDGKFSVYEGGVRVVAFATWKGKITPGSVVDEPIHIVDMFTTLIKIAGGSTAKSKPLDGHDVWDVIAHGAKSPRTETVLNIAPNSGAIRIGDYKLVKKQGRRARNQGDESTGNYELYNIREDIREKTDLAEKQPEKLKELIARYEVLEASAAKPHNEGDAKPPGWTVPSVYGQQ
ncbi:arylsulfatase B [Lacunimicrobium album]